MYVLASVRRNVYEIHLCLAAALHFGRGAAVPAAVVAHGWLWLNVVLQE